LITSCNPSAESPTIEVTATPTLETALPTESTPLPDNNVEAITIWIPPLLAPDTPAGSLFAEHLTTFEDAYTFFSFDVRVKGESGPSGIIETLSSASHVAPSTLPDIVLLDSAALNAAALKGLITPLEGIIPRPETPAWYEYAISAANVDGTFYGLPFMSEAEAFAYRKEAYEAEPKDWADLLGSAETFLLPLGDQEAKFTLIQYIALGGEFLDESDKPTINVDILTDLFNFYVSANEAGLLPLYSLQLFTAQDTWAALQQGNSAASVIPLEALREEVSLDSFLVTPWPTLNGSSVIPTKSWTWAAVVTDDKRQETISQVLQWLLEPTFLGNISLSLGMLPVTTAALEEWSESDSSAVVSRMLRVAVPEPSAEEIATYGPLLQSAIEDVLTGRSTPEEAAEYISEQVEIP
jgi:multiple sugar transport system substrate-binding protein